MEMKDSFVTTSSPAGVRVCVCVRCVWACVGVHVSCVCACECSTRVRKCAACVRVRFACVACGNIPGQVHVARRAPATRGAATERSFKQAFKTAPAASRSTCMDTHMHARANTHTHTHTHAHTHAHTHTRARACIPHTQRAWQQAVEPDLDRELLEAERAAEHKAPEDRGLCACCCDYCVLLLVVGGARC